MALTRITQGVIKPNENYDTHNINSTGIVTATGLNISGNASIGGVLTYEDVTNVDSVGLLTARSGIRFGGHILPTVNESYDIGSADYKVRHLFLSDNSLKFVDSSDTEHPLSVDSGRLKFAGGMLLGSDIQLDPISGIITATSFVKGDGSPVGGVVSDAQQNTVGGTNAGDSFSGTNAEKNTLFGYDAGTNISTGDNNTAFGYNSLSSCTSGYDNIALGWGSATSLVGAHNNVIVGRSSGTGLSNNGNHNVVLGNFALRGGDASQNVAIGDQCLKDAATNCIRNTAVGMFAGEKITTGAANICVGFKAGRGGASSTWLTTGSNNIVIGNETSPSASAISNEITLGNSSITKLRVPGIGVTFASSGNNISGITTFSSNIHLGDTSSGSLYIGAGNDFRLYHNGQNSVLAHLAGTPNNGGGLFLDSATYITMRINGSTKAIECVQYDAVKLYHNGSQKFTTKSSGVEVAGSITDNKGDLRKIPLDTYNSSHTLVVQNAGETVYISSGGVTIPSGTFSQGDAVTIINNSGSDQTITCSAVTAYLAGDTSSKSSLTLKGRGMATFYFVSSSEVYGSGAGLE